jgi:DNA-binding beta-propeller fold protein YncE
MAWDSRSCGLTGGDVRPQRRIRDFARLIAGCSRAMGAGATLSLLLVCSMSSAATAQSLAVTATQYPTLGNPTSAVTTSDGKYIFVSVTNVGTPNFTGPDSAAGARIDVVSGIQIFHVVRNQLVASGFVRTGNAGANGLVLLAGEKTLAVGVGDEGVVFLDVTELLKGNAKPRFADQGEKAGTFDVVATADGKFVFSANEYGIVDKERGSIGVIATGIDKLGHVQTPKTLRRIPVGDVVPSLTISHDGKRLYVATELVPSNKQVSIAGQNNPLLTRRDCVQQKGTLPRGNGFISVIDIGRATSGSIDADAIVSRVAAGCSPVRLAESANGSSLFVTARGDNSVLQYHVAALAADAERSFQRAIPSGGDAPVGLRLFDQDRLLAVANSNRFADGAGNLAVLDFSSPRTPSKIIPAGTFPRNISLGHSPDVLLLTNYSSRSLEVVRIVRSSK